jgi:aminopeptidase N
MEGFPVKTKTKIIAIIAALFTLCGAGCTCAFLIFIISQALTGIGFSAISTPMPPLPPPPVPTVEVNRLPTEGASSADGSLFGADGIGDPYFPQMGNGGYDALHYDLAIDVDMDLETISATATIQALSRQVLGRFNLDFAGFNIDSIKVDGAKADFSRADGELVIAPAAEIPSDTEFTVEVVYAGRPGEGEAYGGIEFLEGWNFYPDGVIVAGEPTGAETWYPSNNHPRDKATFTFHITVAKPFVVAANGVLKERTDHGATWTYEWEMDDPMATYLATIAIGNFEIREKTSKTGVLVRDYLDADIRDDVDASTAVLPEALDFFSSIFGPYPFDACGVVVHELEIPFALENQTLIVLGYTFAYEIVVVHELAHQWFGDSVSVASWKDIWLNEGFASYAETLWWEHTEGAGALREDLTNRYEYLSSIPASRTDPIGDPGPDHLFDPEVYDRGALTLHALRLKVGDPAFFRILQEFYSHYRNGNAVTADFIALAEEISGQDLDGFFQAWLFETSLPDIPELGLSS